MPYVLLKPKYIMIMTMRLARDISFRPWLLYSTAQIWSLDTLECYNERGCNQHHDISPCPSPSDGIKEPNATLEAWTNTPFQVPLPSPSPSFSPYQQLQWHCHFRINLTLTEHAAEFYVDLTISCAGAWPLLAVCWYTASLLSFRLKRVQVHHNNCGAYSIGWTLHWNSSAVRILRNVYLW